MLVIDLTTKKEYEITATKQGENQQTCPVCSPNRKKKTDKCFSFNLLKGAGRCNHCGVVLVEKKDMPKKHIEIEYKRPLFKNDTEYPLNVQTFFKQRCISEKTLLKFKVTHGREFMPQFGKEMPVINFNYFRNGELINVKYRAAQKAFKLVKDAELIFYNLDCAIDNETIIIVEGEMDALAMAEAGYDNVISVPNGANLNKNNLTYLDNSIDFFTESTKFILALDNDQAGINLQNELVRRLGAENCQYVRFKDCKDANECLMKYGIQGIIESMQDKKEFPIEGVFTAKDIEENIYSFYNNGLPKGDGIGMDEHDMFIKFVPGYLTTITGIPGHGKSEYLDFILTRLNVLHGWKIAMYSPENHPLELHFSKFAEKIIGKPFEGYGKMNTVELNAMISYHTNNFYFINPEENFTLENILDSVKQLVRKKGIKAFVIDAWNKLDHHYSVSETKYISEKLDKLVGFCEKNKVHCFLVAHPTKITKDKATQMYEVPNLYSISGSANFYNKTANGITVYRNYQTGLSEIYIQKVKFKHWGQTGCLHLAWDRHNGRYYKGNPDSSSWLNIKEQEQTKITENTNFLTEGINIFEGEVPF
jgi:twinkle protein